MSSSADLFLLIIRILVSLHLKYEQQVIDNNLIGKKLAELSLDVNIEKHTRMILMGFNFSSEIERKMEQNGYVRYYTR